MADLVTGVELAADLGVSKAAISQAVKAGRLRYADPDLKLFDRKAARRTWMATSKRYPTKRRRQKRDKLADDLMRERLREQRAAADLRELDVKERRRDLLDVQVVEKMMSPRMRLIVTFLRNLPHRLAAVCGMNRDQTMRAKRHIDDELRAIAQQLGVLQPDAATASDEGDHDGKAKA